jgi:hypothetical protein
MWFKAKHWVWPWAASALILAALVRSALIGFPLPFSGDDVMNMYRAWTISSADLFAAFTTFTPPGTRPTGALIYRAVYAVFGFHAQPLHWVVWCGLALNLYLAWRLFRALGATEAASRFACLPLAMHQTVRDLSFNAGTLYDTFCFTLYVAVLLVYIAARRRGAAGIGMLLALGLLTALALDAKEMAASIPLALLAWELLFHPPRNVWRWPLSEGRGVLVTGAIVAIFTAVHAVAQGPMSGADAYRPVLTFARWSETTGHYLALLFYSQGTYSPGAIAAIYAAILAVAALSRSRLAVFCALWFPMALLPISFIPPRPGYALYIPMLLWCLLAGMLIAYPMRGSRIAEALSLLLIAAAMTAINRHPRVQPESVEESPVARTASQFAQLYPQLPSQAKLLFLNDAFSADVFDLLFTLRLHYHDDSLTVHRLKANDAQLPHYDRIFTYAHGRYVELNNTDTARTVKDRLMRGQRLSDYIVVSQDYVEPYFVKDVLDSDGEYRWTAAQPEFRFYLSSATKRTLRARFIIPEVTLSQTGPKRIRWFVNGTEVAATRYDSAGEKLFTAAIADGLLRPDAENYVRMPIENPYIAPADKQPLGVVLMEIGFR